MLAMSCLLAAKAVRQVSDKCAEVVNGSEGTSQVVSRLTSITSMFQASTWQRGQVVHFDPGVTCSSRHCTILNIPGS